LQTSVLDSSAYVSTSKQHVILGICLNNSISGKNKFLSLTLHLLDTSVYFNNYSSSPFWSLRIPFLLNLTFPSYFFSLDELLYIKTSFTASSGNGGLSSSIFDDETAEG